MKKRIKKKNNDHILIIIILIMLVFSYFEINSNIRFGGLLRDTLFITKTNDKSNISLTISDELKKENNELKKLLELDYSLTDFEIINASVVERKMNYWLNEMTINKGINDGINNNMIVVTNDGVVGKVIDSAFKTSKVKLITGFNEPVSVKVNDLNKILTIEDNNLIIKGINKRDNIKVNDEVLTSGLSDIFPRGLLIGTIDKIEEANDNVELVASVKVSTDINYLNYVMVLKRINK